jgi:protein ImuB
VDRLACVDVHAFPLQLLVRAHPDWAGHAVAVVEEDRPQGLILWVNEEAHGRGVRRGQRYAEGLGLADDLRGGEVAAEAIAAGVAALTERLRQFTPHVEPSADEPGVFWLDAAGLQQLYPSLQAWAQQIRRGLRQMGFEAVVVVGFRRFACYAVARARPKTATVVFASAAQEEAAAQQVPLDRVGLPPETRDALKKLAVRTVGDFLRLPSAGILRRFGREAHHLHQMAAGQLWQPLQPQPARAPDQRTLPLDELETDFERLTFLIKQLLDPLLDTLAARGEALTAIDLRLQIDGAGTQAASPVQSARGGAGEPSQRSHFKQENIRPAAPTLDIVQLLGLVRLRLESLTLGGGVRTLEVAVQGVRASPEELALFAQRPKRDLDAAARAFARLRASYGRDTVVRAQLREGHLPEARYSWEPLERLALPQPRRVSPRPLVRRLFVRPQPLAPREARAPDGWLARGPAHGPVEQLMGPYLVSGGWWHNEIEREYYFAELRAGGWVWIYYDRRRRRWFLQGEVA